MINVSVIILCHNNKSINSVIDAVIPQLDDYDEIFVVDDYSNEDTRKLLDKYKKSKVQILVPKLKGNRAANRNLAVSQARGDLFVFIDGDVVLKDNAISLIKLFNYDGVAGLCGSVAAMRMTPEVVSINMNKYFEPIAVEDFSFETWHGKFPDLRNTKQLLPWNRFYTALSVIPREMFYRAGKFDEGFNGWGGEDIDMGYRLTHYGRLLISKDIQAVHVPHERNIKNEEKTGRQNMYKMLYKYRNRDMEELLSFALAPYITEGINLVLKIMRKVDDNSTLDNLSENDLGFYPVSSKNQNGKIVYHNNAVLKEEEFLGLALPFEDCRFENVHTSTLLFDYPEPLAARIIQELLRVSNNVILEKLPSNKIEWRELEDKFRYIFCYYKTYLFADSYQDFSIKDMGKRYVIETNINRR